MNEQGEVVRIALGLAAKVEAQVWANLGFSEDAAQLAALSQTEEGRTQILGFIDSLTEKT